MRSAPLPANEPQRLAALKALQILDTPPEERFDRITRLAQHLLHVPIVLISLVDAERQWFKSRQGLAAQETNREVSFCAHAILDFPTTLVVPDALLDERFSHNPLVTGDPHIRFYAGQPVAAPDGSPVGTLCVIDRQPRQFNEKEIRLIKDLAALAENELTLSAVTRQREAYERALKAEMATVEEQARFTSLLLENVPVGVVAVANDGHFMQVNRAFASMVGYSPAELLEKNFRDLSPPDRLEEDERFCQMVFSGQSTGRYETERLHKTGVRVAVQVSATPLKNQTGTIIGLLASVEDITQRKQAEQKILALNRQLEQRVVERTAELSQANAELAWANRRKDEFLAAMSHELRTPLNAVLGASESLQEGILGPLNQDQLEAAQDITNNGGHLLTLITKILDFSKLETGKLEAQPEQVSVREICRASLRLVQPQARQKQLKVITSFDESVTTVFVDERHVKQILVNLLGNAVKFTPAGGQLGLEIIGDDAEQQVRFTVWDRGIGIEPEDKARLFQPFVQLDSRLSRQYEGAGLGLALVRRLVEMNGGCISVESEPGQGSRFTVSLPQTPATAILNEAAQ